MSVIEKPESRENPFDCLQRIMEVREQLKDNRTIII